MNPGQIRKFDSEHEIDPEELAGGVEGSSSGSLSRLREGRADAYNVFLSRRGK